MVVQVPLFPTQPWVRRQLVAQHKLDLLVSLAGHTAMALWVDLIPLDGVLGS